MHIHITLAALAAATLLACAADDSSGGADAGGIDVSALTYAPCDADSAVGEFRVDLTDTYTGVQGSVADGVVPVNVPELHEELGECRLLGARSLFCDPACVPGETCSDTGACIAYPMNRDVGMVSVRGLLVDVDMSASAPGYFYTNPESLPHPGFAGGEGIALDAAGADFGGFSLLGWGVTPMTASATAADIELGQDLVAEWQAPADTGPARVRLILDVNRHGGTPIWIECDVADTGSYSIPAALVDELVDFGLSGFPTLTLSRRTTDSVTIEPGCVELHVVSDEVLDVNVPGLTSCSDDEDCTAPETCQPDLSCG